MRHRNPGPDSQDRSRYATRTTANKTLFASLQSTSLVAALAVLGFSHILSASDAHSAGAADSNATSYKTATLLTRPHADPTPPRMPTASSPRNRTPWTHANGLSYNGMNLLARITTANAFGIDPARLHLDELAELLGTDATSLIDSVQHNIFPNAPRASLPKISALMTSAFKLMVNEVMNGRVSPKESQRYWFAEQDKTNADDWWEMVRYRPDSLNQMLNNLARENRHVAPLIREMEQHQEIADAGGWIQVPEGPTLEPGQESERVSILRARLVMSGDYDLASHSASTDYSNVYSAELEEAVKRYQARHGLVTDGLVGKATIANMNVPVEKRIEQMRVNLERHRWLPNNFGDRHLVTNIPDFRLRVVRHGQTTLEMPVVVGKKKHMTPVFSAEMNHIVVNPTWTVPQSIADKELVPDERSNPGHLERKGFEVLTRSGNRISYASVGADAWHSDRFPYMLRQKPGKRNALGKVKFMLPNPYAIYLHDTPAKKLFSKHTRAFSHGCVRVGNPRKLADHLLQEQGWSKKDLDRLFARSKTKRINLEQPLTNHIIYLTSWVDDDGVLQFRNDIYSQDKSIARALKIESAERLAMIENFRSLQPIVMVDDQ